MHLRPRMGLRLELFGMRHFCPRRRRTASSRIIVERFLSEAVGDGEGLIWCCYSAILPVWRVGNIVTLSASF
jgi:hypothetical protein